MKHSLHSIPSILFATIVMSGSAFAQSPKEATKTDQPTKDTPAVKVWREFMNLPLEKRKEFGGKLLRIQNMFNQKRIFDALAMIDEVDSIFKDHPATLNIKGACYVEIRAFGKATAIFNRILKIAPDNINVQFNLAEVDFVTKRWESAHNRFEKILSSMGENNIGMLRLCEFKLLLCKINTNREKEAKSLAEKYDEWDDSPFYYYSRAALLYNQDNRIDAEKMLSNARFVWRNNSVLAPWQDTLIEFGYIRSFYGGDIVPDSKNNGE